MDTCVETPERLLAAIAEYRAVGCRWSIIAWRMEMTRDEVRALVNRDRKAFRRRVRWIIQDRQVEKQAKEMARLRRNLAEALTELTGRSASPRRSWQPTRYGWNVSSNANAAGDSSDVSANSTKPSAPNARKCGECGWSNARRTGTQPGASHDAISLSSASTN